MRFALDDFGTGYSSLGYINKFPFKKIKVDRSFVSGPNVGKKSDAIIRAVAEMGSTLDMDIVAEGLETIEQVQAVRDAGCTLGQGYYFSRAVPDYLAAMLLAQERGREPPARARVDLAPPLRGGVGQPAGSPAPRRPMARPSNRYCELLAEKTVKTGLFAVAMPRSAGLGPPAGRRCAFLRDAGPPRIADLKAARASAKDTADLHGSQEDRAHRRRQYRRHARPPRSEEGAGRHRPVRRRRRRAARARRSTSASAARSKASTPRSPAPTTMPTSPART